MRNYPFARGRVRMKKAEPVKPAEKVVEEVKEEIPYATSGYLQVIEEGDIPAIPEEITVTTAVAVEEQPIPKKKKKKKPVQE